MSKTKRKPTRRRNRRPKTRWVLADDGAKTIMATAKAMGMTLDELAEAALVSPRRLRMVVDGVQWMSLSMLECLERVAGEPAPEQVYWLLDQSGLVQD